MIKAVPYIQTSGSEKFKDFLNKPFTLDMLFPVFNDKSCDLLFEDWRGKDMINWFKFTNDDGVVLEFYPDKFIIKKSKKHITYQLQMPITINDFIIDCERYGIDLYWTTWIDLNFEPKEYLHAGQIKTYWADLLNKMGKSHELL